MWAHASDCCLRLHSMPTSLLEAEYPAGAVKEYYARLCQGKKLYVAEGSKLHGKVT